ncbi:MAG TPA: redoxin domain-containing protein [Candidatus Hydrogenedentes bacterium]|nr:redoxin domain-containing protein [Candidatus Hydrogenedentota bacterium]HOS02285.1 redoxin domain-containing protein [Candidatus Hydrogenedentota bacterium]
MNTQMRYAIGLAWMAVGALWIVPQTALAAPSLQPGMAAPDFVLQDHAGKTHALADYKNKIVVLNFSSQLCPWSIAVDKDLPRLAAEYASKDVVVLSIDSHKDTRPDEIKAYAEEHKLPYPILKDAGNAYADAVGATRTPEFFVLNKEGKIVYHGPFDDRKAPDETGETAHLKTAIDETIAGTPVSRAEIPAWGCSIKRVKK